MFILVEIFSWVTNSSLSLRVTNSSLSLRGGRRVRQVMNSVDDAFGIIDKSKHELQEFAPNDQVWAQDPTIASGFWAMDPTTMKWSIKASIIRARNETSYQVTDVFKEFPIDRGFLRRRAGPWDLVDQVTNYRRQRF